MAKELPNQNISSPRDLFDTFSSSGLVFQTEITELFVDSGASGGTISGRFVNGRPNGFGFF